MASTTTLVCGKCGMISRVAGNPRKCMECGQDSVRIYAKRAEMSTLNIQTEVVGVSG